MDVNESAYKIIVRYTGKRVVERTIVLRGAVTLEHVFNVRDRYQSDPEVLSVDLVRTRRPRPYNYDFYETEIMVDDSGIVSTPSEKDLMFRPAAKQQAISYSRTDDEKAAWGRNNTFPAKTCLWM